ncbi:MAG TPA: hypothetical protein VJU34_12815 [Phenylobacterium sp.]|nr:hypothetical protein [Phenylobacterium sp.]
MLRLERWLATLVLGAASAPSALIVILALGAAATSLVHGEGDEGLTLVFAALFGGPMVVGWFWWRRGAYAVAAGCGLLLMGALAFVWTAVTALMGFD